MEQSELVRLVVRALESLKIPYMITGSQASAYYGEPRFTRDIDIVADIKPEQVDAFTAFFPSNEFYCEKDMIKEEIKYRGQFNIIHAASGLKIDIILTKTTEFSRRVFRIARGCHHKENGVLQARRIRETSPRYYGHSENQPRFDRR